MSYHIELGTSRTRQAWVSDAHLGVLHNVRIIRCRVPSHEFHSQDVLLTLCVNDEPLLVWVRLFGRTRTFRFKSEHAGLLVGAGAGPVPPRQGRAAHAAVPAGVLFSLLLREASVLMLLLRDLHNNHDGRYGFSAGRGQGDRFWFRAGLRHPT